MPENHISFADPRYHEYTCEDPQEATNKKPQYYILQGERVNATNFAQMLRSVILRLYAMDPSPIEQMARFDEQLLPWSQNILFSYDPTKVSGKYINIDGTTILVSQGFSASHIVQIIRALLEKYDIGQDDFVYSARPSYSPA